MVEVTQDDREAAMKHHCSEWVDLTLAEAFARHRIAAFNAALEAAETLRLRQVLTEWDEGFEAALNAVRNLKIGDE